MTSRERMVAVLEHRLPDRVPLMELWIDPAVTRALLPGARWNDWNELVVALDMDCVTVPTMVYGEEEVEWVDPGLFRDKWGALQILGSDAVPVPAKPPRIETPEDLATYRPPDPARSPVIRRVRELRERFPHGEKAVGVIGESGWAPAVYLRGGLDNLLLDFALRPAFVKDLMRIGTDYYRELYGLVLREGADIVLLGDDYADKNGPMMSPAQFEDIILPCDAAVVASVKSAGGYCIKHIDGDVRKIMDQLVATGLDCLGPLEPVPGMELEGILARYPGRITVMGNVSVDLLSSGTPEEVTAETRRLLATVSAHGPHIMSSGNTIASSVRPENFLAMVETTKKHGSYPIPAGR